MSVKPKQYLIKIFKKYYGSSNNSIYINIFIELFKIIIILELPHIHFWQVMLPKLNLIIFYLSSSQLELYQQYL